MNAMGTKGDMHMRQIGFIGAGNMGSAIIRGAVADGFVKAHQIMI